MPTHNAEEFAGALHAVVTGAGEGVAQSVEASHAGLLVPANSTTLCQNTNAKEGEDWLGGASGEKLAGVLSEGEHLHDTRLVINVVPPNKPMNDGGATCAALRRDEQSWQTATMLSRW